MLPAGLPTGLCRSPELQAALSYARQVHTADAGTMFLQPYFRFARIRAPLLRGLVLSAIRPGVDGTLPGYSPSPAFAQTHAKGWARDGPAGSRGNVLAARAVGGEVAADSGIGLVAGLVLPWVGGRSLAVAAALVSKEWRQLIYEDPACQAALEAAREEREMEEQEREREREEQEMERQERERQEREEARLARYFGYGSP
jgi:hypothetical protein